MRDIKDVLLYLARHVPAGHEALAEMERIVHEHFAGTPQAQPAAPPEGPREG